MESRKKHARVFECFRKNTRNNKNSWLKFKSFFLFFQPPTEVIFLHKQHGTDAILSLIQPGIEFFFFAVRGGVVCLNGIALSSNISTEKAKDHEENKKSINFFFFF